MFACEECGRSYRSQYALSRHLQNHNTDVRYTCQTCHVAYSRRDLLARHAKIHQQARNDGSSVQSDASRLSSSSPTYRQRRHTACVRCAEQRKRCSGNPCRACTRAGETCSFPVTRGRISRSNINSDTIATEDTEVGVFSTDARQDLFLPIGESRTSILDRLIAPVVPSQEDPVAPPVQISHAEVFNPIATAEGSGHNAGQSANIFETDSYDLESWVWLHEDLYLQGDTQLLISNDITKDPGLWETSVPRKGSMSDNSDLLGTHYPTTNDQSADRHIASGDSTPDHRRRFIDKLVSYAAMVNFPVSANSDHGEYWISVSWELKNTFEIGIDHPHHTLQCFIDLYLQHFWPLWPLLAQHDFSADHLHPLLYLVLVSIGAMYGDMSSVQFGRLLHKRICVYLTVSFEPDDSDADFIWLAQARLYSQVAALYFGLHKAFTYAQHLGALLVAQARRIELFSADFYEHAINIFMSLQRTPQTKRRLDIWLQLEARRRLAFGIFRADVYCSVLMDIRPLLSLNEIDVSFPSCDAVWRATEMPVEACLHLIEHDRTPSKDLRASDIYAIALDPDEPLPPMNPLAHELLLFGLQRSLERFAYGRSSSICSGMAPVSKSTGWSSTPGQGNTVLQSSLSTQRESAQLLAAGRRMRVKKLEFDNMLRAQSKWEAALPHVKAFVVDSPDRNALMSGLVLFHLGFLRLHAPISRLHQLQYRMIGQKPIDRRLLATVSDWATTDDAHLAAERACDLFNLVAHEAYVTGVSHVNFNLLAFIAMHHAVVLLWCYATAHEKAVDSSNSSQQKLGLVVSPARDANSAPSLRLGRGASDDSPHDWQHDVPTMIGAFVDIFSRISPGKWSSFAEAASPLAQLALSSV
jgi:hypothetical protein